MMKIQPVVNPSMCSAKADEQKHWQHLHLSLSEANKCVANNNKHTNILSQDFLTPCKASKSLRVITAAYHVRLRGAVNIFPHEALKVMESQDLQLHGVHQEHWQEYQELHRLAQRGNASTLTCQRKSQKKGLWMLQNWVSKRQGLSTHCRNNETSFNTHRAWGIHSRRRRSMEKRALYLKQKNTE